MLRGSESATVDAKGRLKIPAIFLPELRKLGDEFFVTSETGTFAWVYPRKVWEAIEEKLDKLPAHDPTVEKYQDLTSYYGQQVSIDAQGRILIPVRLREDAQLLGEVDVLGKQKALAIWNHSRFYEQKVRANGWSTEDARTFGSHGM
jgi:MraZ protein